MVIDVNKQIEQEITNRISANIAVFFQDYSDLQKNFAEGHIDATTYASCLEDTLETIKAALRHNGVKIEEGGIR